MNEKKNAGYSLVELIIVLAIMAILSGAAMLTLSSVNNARASSAKETFNQALSTLQTMTKSQDADYAMMLVKIDNDFYIRYGTYDGTNFSQNGDEETLSRTAIYYNGTEITDGNYVIIKFNKSDGSVASGEGVYEFCKQNSTSSVGTVTLNQATGSHYTGS